MKYYLALAFTIVLSLLKTQAQTSYHKYPKGLYHGYGQLVYDSVKPNSTCEIYVKIAGNYTSNTLHGCERLGCMWYFAGHSNRVVKRIKW